MNLFIKAEEPRDPDPALSGGRERLVRPGFSEHPSDGEILVGGVIAELAGFVEWGINLGTGGDQRPVLKR